jgi:membrane-bound lytic murein transglycosylase D
MLARGPRDVISVILGSFIAAGTLDASAAPRAPLSSAPLLGTALAVPLRIGPGRGNGQRDLQSSRALTVVEPRRSSPAERTRRPNAGSANTPIPPLVELPPGPNAELVALRQAERRLFPRSVLRNPNADLPSAVPHAGPVLSVSGLPFGAARRKPAPGRESAPGLGWPVGLNLPNLPVAFEQSTLEYIRFYRESARGRAIADNWARKLGRYGPAIVAELAQQGLPTDLVYLSLIESGHNPTIVSSAGAAGLWQFIPESARAYGLTVDRWVDERLDPVRSTRAAARLLRDLERRFGTWDLAMAAYNMGHQGLTRSIRKYNTNDFWRLTRLEAALPWETALYVPKVMAVAIVMKNRGAFGLGHVEPDPAVSFETVLVPAGVSFANIATRAGVAKEEIASLNPHYLASRTPPASPEEPARRWAVHVPRGRGGAVARWLAEPAQVPRHATYRLRVGDTLASAAARLRIPEAELRGLNAIAHNEAPKPGTLLILPAGAADTRRPPPEGDSEELAVLPPLRFHYPDRERVYYRTLAGDDLARLAQAFKVRSADLVRWNGLDPDAHLQADMLLSVYVQKGERLDGVRHLRERNLQKRLEVASPGFFAHFEAEQGRQRLQISARDGDTLAGIGKRYGLSAGMMERINHFSRNQRLAAGTPVTVYAKSGPVETEVLLSRTPDPLPPVQPPYPAALPLAGASHRGGR